MQPEAIDSMAMGQLGADAINDTINHTLGQWGVIVCTADAVITSITSTTIRGTMPLTMSKGERWVGQFTQIQLASGSVICYNYTTQRTDILPPEITPVLASPLAGRVTVTGTIPANCSSVDIYRATAPAGINGPWTLASAGVTQATPLLTENGLNSATNYYYRVMCNGNGLAPYMSNKAPLVGPATASINVT